MSIFFFFHFFSAGTKFAQSLKLSIKSGVIKEGKDLSFMDPFSN